MPTRERSHHSGWIMPAVAISVTIAGSVLASYILLRVSSAVASEQIVTLQREDVKLDDRVDAIERAADETNKTMNQLAVQQATLAANVELLVRAQGLQPIKVPATP